MKTCKDCQFFYNKQDHLHESGISEIGECLALPPMFCSEEENELVFDSPFVNTNRPPCIYFKEKIIC